MNTCVHLYLTEFFLEREMYDTKVVEEIETTHFMFDNLFQKIVPFVR